MNKLHTWFLASRPKTLPAALAPVLVGTALAFRESLFNLPVFVATALAALLIQIGTNFANDLYDFLKGSDREDRLGPTRVTQVGLLTSGEVKAGIILVFGLALVIGFYLAYIGGWPIVIIGSFSIISGIAYTGGPYPIGYHGWGDFFVFIFFGLIAVSGTYYLQTGNVTGDSLLFGAALGAFSTAILIINNLRDADADRLSGKNTLAVRFGKNFVRFEYILMIILAYTVPVYFAIVWKHLPLYLTWFSVPMAGYLILAVWTESGRMLNPVLHKTARLLLVYTILLVMGLLL